MSFNISLSGLSAMQKALDVTSNNIANVATTGFKSSRAEFADVYTTSVMANGRTTVGSGVQTAVVSQQFAQGAVESTNNTLDLAISGEGFFVLNATDSKENIYTRAGNFEIDEVGNVISNSGYYLQVYDVNEDGTVKSMSLDSTKNLVIPTKAGTPTQTNKVTSLMNLNAGSPEVSSIEDASGRSEVMKFDPTDSNTYSASTTVVVYDSLGESHSLSYYYIKTTDPDPNVKNTWNMYLFMDGQPVDIENGVDTRYTDIAQSTTYGNREIKCAQIKFDQNGALITPTNPEIIKTVKLGTDAGILNNGADPDQQIVLNNSLTQYSAAFSVTQLSQNGSTVGQLTGLDIDGKGLVRATYSNGTSVNIGMVAMATFANNQGLSKIGDTCWKESLTSGEAVPSRAGVGTTGTIKSSALESSNVDLSASLVQLIMAQRNYQANSKSLEASSNIMQTILNVS
ncbi:MAG: flagellar hook protein FlgE [Succinivibrionaceae bacterium]|nr:flagellar hook protein FlgE [Succinivibrionaceae bacterium]